MNEESRLREFGEAVGRAQGFVEVAKLVCVATKRLCDLDRCTVSLYSASGQPVLTVDQRTDLTDEQRLRALDASSWRADPLNAAMRASQVPVRDAGDGGEACTWLLPIIGPAGVVGSIRCEQRARFSHAVERELLMLGMLVSVRLAHLRIAAVREPCAVSQLTPRQLEVGALAARGLTNLEIAAELGLSPNTVKNRLKEVFERLDVLRRVELVHAFDGFARSVDVPLGITRDGAFTITCVTGA